MLRHRGGRLLLLGGLGAKVRIWMPAVRGSVGEQCTFHDLRHTTLRFSSLKVSTPSHQERLSHASIKTTLDTYGHLFDGLDEEAAQRLDTSWRDSRVEALWTQSGRGVIKFSSR